MVLESRYGLMVPSTREGGRIIRLTEEAFSGMLMEMYLMVNGKKTRHMALALTLMSMGQSMKVSGDLICNTDRDKKSGKMEVVMMAPTQMV